MVIFLDGAAAGATDQVIRRAMERLKAAPEFKFNKTNDRIKDGFFEAVCDCSFAIRALVVKKDVISVGAASGQQGRFLPLLCADDDDLR